MSTDLVAFLRARLREDECSALAAASQRHPARPLADVEAKRQQIDLCEYMAGWNDEYDRQVTPHEIKSMHMAAEMMLRWMASPYPDHADYREEWKP